MNVVVKEERAKDLWFIFIKKWRSKAMQTGAQQMCHGRTIRWTDNIHNHMKWLTGRWMSKVVLKVHWTGEVSPQLLAQYHLSSLLILEHATTATNDPHPTWIQTVSGRTMRTVTWASCARLVFLLFILKMRKNVVMSSRMLGDKRTKLKSNYEHHVNPTWVGFQIYSFRLLLRKREGPFSCVICWIDQQFFYFW